jgi:hypothetical protein
LQTLQNRFRATRSFFWLLIGGGPHEVNPKEVGMPATEAAEFHDGEGLTIPAT